MARPYWLSPRKLSIVRVGASFISIDQAQKNLWLEIPDTVSDMTDGSKLMIGTSEYTAANVRRQWGEKLDGLEIEGASNVEKEILSIAVAQYRSEQHEFMLVSIWQRGPPHWIWRGIRYWLFSLGYFPCSMGTADSILPRTYTWFFQLHAGWVSASTHLSPISDLTDWLFRVVASLYGRTHADSLVVESVKKSATGSNRELAWQALWNATVPLRNDVTSQYGNREEVLSLFASIALMVLLNVAVYWLRSWSWSANVL